MNPHPSRKIVRLNIFIKDQYGEVVFFLLRISIVLVEYDCENNTI
jgi:hypothetical protein